MIEISVVIPTFKRCDQLRICLLALAAQERVAMQSVEVIVVENGPKCGVKEMVDSFGQHFQSLRYVYEAVPGVSRARNVGMENAGGTVLVFLDDDEVPGAHWLSELTEPFRQDGKRADIVCGENKPVWGAERPTWLTDDLLRCYTVDLQWSSELVELEDGQWVAEGNCAVRADLLRAAGGFRTDLGRVGTDLLSGEGAVFDELRSKGAVAMFNPNAIVEHYIFAEQLTLNWLFRRWFAQGREDAIKFGDNFPWLGSLSGSAIRMDAFAKQDHEQLADDQVLTGVQLYRALGFLCQKQRVL